MSGIEVAGLVIPLFLTAFENWEACVQPFKRLKKFDKEARDFCGEVEIQRAIFRNECCLLLYEIHEHDIVNGMLESLEHKDWKNEKTDASLAQLLGSSLDGIQTTIRLLNCELGHLAKVIDGLSEVLDLELQGTPKPLRDKVFKKGLGQKLRFSCSEKHLSKRLSKLESLNNSLVLLSNQTKRSVSSNDRATKRRSDVAKTNVRRYQTIGKVSCQVYEALSRACTKHTEHLAHFSVEVEQVDFRGDLYAQVKFSMAFTHQNLKTVTARSEPVWLSVDSVLDERIREAPRSAEDASQADGSSSTRRGSELSEQPKKRRKRVQFDLPQNVMTPNPLPSMIINTESLDGSKRHDFCDYLRRSFCPPLQKDTCVVLEHTNQCKHFVLPSMPTAWAKSRQFLSLRQLICPECPKENVRGLVNGIPIHSRIKLAKILAITVLQYHDTPWLKQLWSSEDIYFFENQENQSAQSLPDISAPHLNTKVMLQEMRTVSTRTIARNPFLFSLGVVLIELAYRASLDLLEEPCDLENGSSHRRFCTARRLAKQANSPMGARYNEIVEQLVECMFPAGANLNDAQVQWKLYEDVVCPLENLERDFEKLYIGEGKN